MLLRLIGKTFAIGLSLDRVRQIGNNQQPMPEQRTPYHEVVKPPSRWRACLSMLLHRNKHRDKQHGPVFTRKEKRKALFLRYERFRGESHFQMRRERQVTYSKYKGPAKNHRHGHHGKQARQQFREMPPQVVPFEIRRYK